jgi:hypothetical protein
MMAIVLVIRRPQQANFTAAACRSRSPRSRSADPGRDGHLVTWRPTGLVRQRARRPRLEWFGRVRGKDGKQRWIKASDLRRAAAHNHEAPRCERRHGPCRGMLKNGSSPPGRPRSAPLVWRSRFAPHRRHSSVSRWVRLSTATICQACQPIKHLNGRAFITPYLPW